MASVVWKHDWSLSFDPQNNINSGLLKKNLKTLLARDIKLKLEREEKYCSQNGNYRKFVFQARLKRLGYDSSINAVMM